MTRFLSRLCWYAKGGILAALYLAEIAYELSKATPRKDETQ